MLAEFTQLKTLGKLVDAYDLKRQRFLEPAAEIGSPRPRVTAESDWRNGHDPAAHAAALAGGGRAI